MEELSSEEEAEGVGRGGAVICGGFVAGTGILTNERHNTREKASAAKNGKICTRVGGDRGLEE